MLFSSSSPSSSFVRSALIFALVTAGCGETESEPPARAELLGSSADRILAIASDGDTVFVAREGSLDRIERDGTIARVGAADYRMCPTDASVEWRPGDEDSFGGTSLVIDGGVATFFDARCGAWTRRLDDGSTRMLLPRAAGWLSTIGTVAVDGGEVLSCFTTSSDHGLGIQLWSAARDGTSVPRLVADVHDGRIDTCRALVADGPRALALAAGDPDEPQRVVGFDRAASDAAPVTIMAGDRFSGLAVDATAVYAIRDGEVVRVDKNDGGERVLVRAEQGRLPDRRLTVAGGFLYWFGSHGTSTSFAKTMERIALSGGTRETVFENDDEPNGLWPAKGLVVRDDGAYFAWWKLMPANEAQTFAVARVSPKR